MAIRSSTTRGARWVENPANANEGWGGARCAALGSLLWQSLERFSSPSERVLAWLRPRALVRYSAARRVELRNVWRTRARRTSSGHPHASKGWSTRLKKMIMPVLISPLSTCGNIELLKTPRRVETVERLRPADLLRGRTRLGQPLDRRTG